MIHLATGSATRRSKNSAVNTRLCRLLATAGHKLVGTRRKSLGRGGRLSLHLTDRTLFEAWLRRDDGHGGAQRTEKPCVLPLPALAYGVQFLGALTSAKDTAK